MNIFEYTGVWSHKRLSGGHGLWGRYHRARQAELGCTVPRMCWGGDLIPFTSSPNSSVASLPPGRCRVGRQRRGAATEWGLQGVPGDPLLIWGDKRVRLPLIPNPSLSLASSYFSNCLVGLLSVSRESNYTTYLCSGAGFMKIFGKVGVQGREAGGSGTAGRVLALNGVHLGLIPSTLYGPQPYPK